MKIIFNALRGSCFAMLLASILAAPSFALPARIFGLNVEIPENWSVKTDAEQVLIYNKNESSAVIVDQVDESAESSAQSVAENLAGAVGVDKKDIRGDAAGGLSMDFTQGGERVNVRVFENKGRVLMVYAFGSDEKTREIASSVGAPDLVRQDAAQKDGAK